MNPLRKTGLLLLVAVIAACVTTPVSNREAFILIPEWQEVSLGKQAFREISEKEKDSEDKAMTKIVERVGWRLAEASRKTDLDWEFRLFESKDKNAFALPGGKVGIFSGILPVCDNEAGLATVMSHEIAHVTARHGAQRMTQQLVLVAGMTAAQISLNDSSSRNAILAALGLGILYGIQLPFSRTDEAEADQIGLVYMARAGYDPREAIKFWGRFSEEKKGPQVPELMSTHPADDTRIANLNRFLARAMVDYNAAKMKHGLGETFNLPEELKEEPTEKPKAVPGVSVEALKP